MVCAMVLALCALVGGAFAQDLISPAIAGLPDGSPPRRTAPMSGAEIEALAQAPAVLRFAVGFAALDLPVAEVPRVTFDRAGPRGMVYLSLPEHVASRFYALTAGHVGQVMEVQLCGIVLNAPTIMSAISGGRVQLLLHTYEEARIAVEVLSGRQPCAALGGLPALAQ